MGSFEERRIISEIEHSLREGTNMRRLWDLVPVGVTIIDQKGQHIFANRRALDTFLLHDLEEMKAGTWSEQFGCLDVNTLSAIPFEELPGVIAIGGEAARREMVFVTPKTGRKGHPYVLHCFPIDVNGIQVGVLSIFWQIPWHLGPEKSRNYDTTADHRLGVGELLKDILKK